MAREGVEIDIERLDICREMDGTLRTIHHHYHVCGMGEGNGTG